MVARSTACRHGLGANLGECDVDQKQVAVAYEQVRGFDVAVGEPCAAELAALDVLAGAGLGVFIGSALNLVFGVPRLLVEICPAPQEDAAAPPLWATQAAKVPGRKALHVESPSMPSSELPLGIAAPYWLDLRDYDPVAVAADLDKPMFILQGGRDCQVTVADDLARWEAGLAGRQEVAIRVYGPDNQPVLPRHWPVDAWGVRAGAAHRSGGRRHISGKTG